jgi:hypothetical protein
MVAADIVVRDIALRVIKDAQWANIYFSHFVGTRDAVAKYQEQSIDTDAEQFQRIVFTGFHRLAALCLFRIWDRKSADKHCIARLVKMEPFGKVIVDKDVGFIADCNRFLSGDLRQKLFEFRDSDLAHSLELQTKVEGDLLSFDDLRSVLELTNKLVDRLSKALEFSRVELEEELRQRTEHCKAFWRLIEPSILTNAQAA